MVKKGLGKGLGSLLDMSDENKIEEIRVSEIEPNRNQPRMKFDEEKIGALTQSIKEHGIIQPIIVKKSGTGYEIIAGERRWRASKKAGIATIPAIIRDFSDIEAYQITLIENLQREDLNPIEEAIGMKRLMDEYGMTQNEISDKVGRSRSAVANSVRLLTAAESIKQAVINGDITSGHARAIMSVSDKDNQEELLKRVIAYGLNVRQTEEAAKRISETKTEKPKKPKSAYDIEIDNIQNKMASALGTKVTIAHKGKKGKIEIEYYSDEDLERLMDIFGMN